MGPESRTRDKVEKTFGLASKARLIEILGEDTILQTQINKDGEDMKGKFGRILGDFQIEVDGETKLATQMLVEEGHAVPYFGGSKDDIKEQHMLNRKRLIDEEVVIMSYDMAGVE